MSDPTFPHSLHEGKLEFETLKRRRRGPSPDLHDGLKHETHDTPVEENSGVSVDSSLEQRPLHLSPSAAKRRGSSAEVSEGIPVASHGARYHRRITSPPLPRSTELPQPPPPRLGEEDIVDADWRFEPVPVLLSPPPTLSHSQDLLSGDSVLGGRDNGSAGYTGDNTHFHPIRMTKERRAMLGQSVGNAFPSFLPETLRRKTPRRHRSNEPTSTSSRFHRNSSGEQHFSWQCFVLFLLWIMVIVFMLGCGVGTVIYLRAQRWAFHGPLGLRTAAPLVLSQSQFVSCNQHDLPQYYWNVMSQTAMTEVYGMASPQSDDHPNNKVKAYEGGCALWEENGDSVSASQRPGKESRTSRPAPLDSFIWLGDIIYSDKEMRGGPPPPPPSPSCVPAPLYPLDMIQKMWEAQFHYSEYKLFRETCVRTDPYSVAVVQDSTQLIRENSTLTNRTNPSPTSMPSLTDDYVSENAVLSSPVVTRSVTCTDSLAQPPDEFRPFSTAKKTAVWGVWDDHDMGQNDAGKEFPWKNVTRQYLFDFLQVPQDDPRRHRGEGVYTFHTVSTAVLDEHLAAPTGATEAEVSHLSAVREGMQLLYENLFCVCLLDVRSLRDPANTTESGDMLGEPQWEWLERVLVERVVSPSTPTGAGGDDRSPRQKCASVLIGGGVQMFLDEKVTEHWGSYPKSRDRILQVLRRHRVERVLFLTGDVHMGELGADFTSLAVQHILGYPIVEATSSGLTHSAESTVSSRNPNSALAALHPMRWLVPSMFPSPRRVGLFVGKNFGSVKMEVGFRDNETAMKEHTHVLLQEIETLKHNLKQRPSDNNILLTEGHNMPSHRGDLTATAAKMEKYQQRVEGHELSKRMESTLTSSFVSLQQHLDSVLNVTLTIFSLDDSTIAMSTARVHRYTDTPAPIGAQLSFPLGMLTYAGGACYIDSVVNPHSGRVYHNASCSSATGNIPEAAFTPSETFDAMQHYPRTAPLPLLTRTVQWIQYHYYPNERMLFVVYLLRAKGKEWAYCFRFVFVLLMVCLLGAGCVWCAIIQYHRRRGRYRIVSTAQERIPLQEEV